jgi:coproporphyrinogen III oxidase-like Fe-S oxidoreductase
MLPSPDWRLYEEALGLFEGQPLSFDRVFPPLTAGAEREPWSFEEVLKEWDAWAQDARSGKGPALLNCYVHFPFCRAKCTYCMHYSREAETRGETRRYLRAQQEQLRSLSGVFKGIELRNLAVGGGTPSLAGPEAVAEWLGTLFECLRFSPDGERTFEANPDSLTPALLRVLKRCGINRLSLGVQTLDRGILKAVNRGYQTTAAVFRAVRAARRMGFEHGVNVDLLLGLAGDTPEGFLDSFRRVVAEEPDGVFVNGLMPTPEYIAAHFNGDAEAALEHGARLRRDLEPRLLDLAAKARYSRVHGREWNWDLMFVRAGVSKFYFSETTFYLAEQTRERFSLLGLGCRSRSHVFGRLHYDQGPLPFDRFDPGAKVYEGFRMEPKDEEFRYALAALCQDLPLDKAMFKRLFKKDLGEALKGELAALVSEGLAEADGREVRFLSKSLRDRTLTAFMLAGPERVERMLRMTVPDQAKDPLPPPAKRQLRLRWPSEAGRLGRGGFEQAVFLVQGDPPGLAEGLAKAKALDLNVVLETDGEALARQASAAKLLPFLDGVIVDLKGKQAFAALAAVESYPKQLGVAAACEDPGPETLQRVSRFKKVRHLVLSGAKAMCALPSLDPAAAKAGIGLRVRKAPPCRLGDLWRYASDLYEDPGPDGRKRTAACSGCSLELRCPGASPGEEVRPLRL